MSSFDEGTFQALAMKPEQSAPYEPPCEQLGQLPEQEPFVDVVGPSGRQRPWPHQYEKPFIDLPRSRAPCLAAERSPVLPPSAATVV